MANRPSIPAQAQALWITSARCAELRSEPLHAPATDEVLVQTLYSGISRGTERLVFEGRVPESEYVRMRAPFQAGDFPYPVKYGYANVGRVIAGSQTLRGQSVFSLYPHQDFFVVPSDCVQILPAELPPARAVLAANMETALNGVWDAQLRAGDRVCVIGAGVVGCLVAYLAARHPGCEVQLVDSDPRKRATAETLGVGFALPSALPRECDVVVHASGAASGLRSALEAAGLEARVVELSWYGDSEVTLPLGAAFHSRRLSLRSSQVGRVPSAQAPRWSTQRRLALALRLLCDARLDALISDQSPFSAGPEVLRALFCSRADSRASTSASEQFALCHRLHYETP
jgi:2-desacetyl-2-hydroxyethyl bacteriochlorophyllide A dehydrogenase